MKVYIITSAKFEECYIEEWVQYNLNIGFDKIIINDNNPKDYPYQLKDILKKYINNGQIVIERYYDHFGHSDDPENEFPKIYTWLYNKYKNEFDWCAKLDIDEYLEISETHNDIKKFLLQKKFENVLSICIPLINFYTKPEFSITYERLKYNKDRFEPNEIKFVQIWNFKSIIRNHSNVSEIGHHHAFFYNDHNINGTKCYALPTGDIFRSRFIFQETYDYNNYLVLEQQKKYFYYIANNICKINHYIGKSFEEYIIKTLKFEGNIKGNLYSDAWNKICKENKELINNPRDLYKLYFIDNINNIED